MTIKESITKEDNLLSTNNNYSKDIPFNTKLLNNDFLTKTGKYIFFIESALYHTDVTFKAIQLLEPATYDESKAFNKLNIYLDDDNNKSYNIKDELKKEEPNNFIYHIKCDTRNPRFYEAINTLKHSSNYVDHYQYDSYDSNTVIIRFKVLISSRVIQLLNSKYSKIYGESELSCIKYDAKVKRLYHYMKVDYDNNNELDLDYVDDVLHVLAADEIMVKRICSRFNITDTDTINIIKNNEFDSKVKLDNEILKLKTK